MTVNPRKCAFCDAANDEDEGPLYDHAKGSGIATGMVRVICGEKPRKCGAEGPWRFTMDEAAKAWNAKMQARIDEKDRAEPNPRDRKWT